MAKIRITGRLASMTLLMLTTVALQAAEFEANSGLAQIGVDKALEAGLTGNGVRVGVIDSGIDSTHPEFAGRYLGGIDYTVSNDPLSGDEHGTHVAGIIGAARDGVGMQGVAPGAYLFSYNVIGDLSDTTVDPFAEGIAHAVANDIHILNASLTDPGLDALDREELLDYADSFRDTFDQAISNDVVMVFATGNEADVQSSALARLPDIVPDLKPGWLAVTSVGPSGEIASYANYCGSAAQWCLAAPGGDQLASGILEDGILSTVPGGGYEYYQGTSMATPHVSGALALGKEAFPDASYQDLATLLLQTSTDIGVEGVDDIYGWGMLNVGNVVTAAQGDHMGIHALSGFGSGVAIDGIIDAVDARSGDNMAANRWNDDIANSYSPETEGLLAPGAVWATPFFTQAFLDAGGTTGPADVTASGLVGGAGLLNLPFGTAGVLAGFSQGDLKASGDEASSSGLYAGIYADVDTPFVVGGMQAGYGSVSTSTERRNIPGLSGTVLDSAVQEGSGREEALWFQGKMGARMNAGIVELNPYVLGGVTNQGIQASTEGNATILAASLDAMDFMDATAGVGLKISGTGLDTGGFVLTPSLDVAYVSHLGDTTYSRSGTVLGNSGSASAESLGQHEVDLGAELSFASKAGPLEMNLGYSGSFRENATGHTAKAAVAVNF